MDIYDKVYYDREYVQNVSLKFDLKVIWKSVLVVLGRKGVVDGRVDPEFRKESIVLLKESQLVKQERIQRMSYSGVNDAELQRPDVRLSKGKARIFETGNQKHSIADCSNK